MEADESDSVAMAETGATSWTRLMGLERAGPFGIAVAEVVSRHFLVEEDSMSVIERIGYRGVSRDRRAEVPVVVGQPRRREQRPREKFIEVVASSDPMELSKYAEAWDELAGRAIEPNVFYEHWMLIPALRLLSEEDVKVALVVERDPNAGMKSRLIGVFPLEQRESLHGLPMRSARLWKHRHCYLANPLVDRGYGQQCWESLLNWLRDREDMGRFLEMPTITGDGPLLQSFEAFAFGRRAPMYVSEFYGRALLELGESGDAYLQSTMSGDHRRGYAKKRKSLAGRGDLQFKVLSDGVGEVSEWAEDFLRLEASGWKGESASAMACDARESTSRVVPLRSRKIEA